MRTPLAANSLITTPSQSKKRVSIDFLSFLWGSAFMGLSWWVPLGNHSELCFLVGTSKTLTQLSSPVTIFCRKSRSFLILSKLRSQTAFLTSFCACVRSFGTNFGLSLLSFRSFFMSLWAEELEMLTCSATSCTVTALFVCKNCWTACKFLPLLALRGLPVLGLSLRRSSPCLNCLCQTLTCPTDIVRSPKTSWSFLQQSIGLSPDFIKNFKTAHCSTRPSIPQKSTSNRTKKLQKETQQTNNKTLKITVCIALATNSDTCTLWPRKWVKGSSWLQSLMVFPITWTVSKICQIWEEIGWDIRNLWQKNRFIWELPRTRSWDVHRKSSEIVHGTSASQEVSLSGSIWTSPWLPLVVVAFHFHTGSLEAPITWILFQRHKQHNKWTVVMVLSALVSSVRDFPLCLYCLIWCSSRRKTQRNMNGLKFWILMLDEILVCTFAVRHAKKTLRKQHPTSLWHLQRNRKGKCTKCEVADFSHKAFYPIFSVKPHWTVPNTFTKLSDTLKNSDKGWSRQVKGNQGNVTKVPSCVVGLPRHFWGDHSLQKHGVPFLIVDSKW